MNDPSPTRYAGLVTRTVAFGLDAVVINTIAVLVGGAVNLVASLLGHQGGIDIGAAIAGGLAWLLWAAAYFVTFWILTGQTPGDRLLGIRVVSVDDERIKPRRAVRRFAGMVLATLPLGAGFLPILVDDRRRGLHDRIAGTVVRWEEYPPPEPRTPDSRLAPESAVPEAELAPGPPVPETKRTPDARSITEGGARVT